MAEIGELCEECGTIVFEIVIPYMPFPVILCACSDLEINDKKVARAQ